MHAPQPRKIGSEAVIAGNHGQTCKAALGGFRLQNHWQFAAAATATHGEAQATHSQTTHSRPRKLNRGSNSQRSKERLSSITSASKARPARSGSVLP